MSFNKQIPNRQNSVITVSPFLKHNYGLDRDVYVNPKMSAQNGSKYRKQSLLGNDLSRNWFKSIDMENGLLTDNEHNSSIDSLYDSPLLFHSPKTVAPSVQNNVTPIAQRVLLDVRPSDIFCKSGDIRIRERSLLETVNINRPTTVGPTREKANLPAINMSNFDGMDLQNKSQGRSNKTKKTQEGSNDSSHMNDKINTKHVVPLPPIKTLIYDQVGNEDGRAATSPLNANYFQKSEEFISDEHRKHTLLKTKEDLNIVNRNSKGSSTLPDKEYIVEAALSPPRFARPHIESYRSVTPLSLCDVISDVNIKEDASFTPGCISISDSDEFDTDLETSEGNIKDQAQQEDTNICRWVYRNECLKYKTPPQKHILKGLAERSLSLRNRSIGPDAIPPLCLSLKDNLRVERLNLEGTDITEDGIQHIAEMMLENITITHLNLANNNLCVRASQVISHVMIATDNLTHLYLAGNKFGNPASWYLSSGIGSNRSITHLDLSYNDFGEHAGVLLGTGIARNTKLVALKFSWNKLCGKGSVAIFQALMVNNVLEVLDVSWNGLGYDGAVALSKCLKVNKSLMDIDVSNNRLDWRCGFLLAEGLAMNSRLQKLKVGHNPLSTTGCMDILESVATLESTINLLDCSGITVVGEADLLAATISRRRKFQFIHGGIVTTHDKVGEKQDREVNPMLRIIEYLRLLGLRPLELMKSFDKSSSFELPRKDFIEQIKKIGVKLQPYEIDALANSVSGKGYNKNVINYRKLSLAVREVVKAERERKMKEREEWMQIKSYHENILRKGQLDYSHTSSKITGVLQAASGVFGASIESVSSVTRVSDSRAQLSMCSPLDSSRSIMYTPKRQKKRIKHRKTKQ